MLVHRFVISDKSTGYMYKSILPKEYPTGRNCMECFNKYKFIELYRTYFKDYMLDYPRYDDNDYFYITIYNRIINPFTIIFTPYMDTQKIIKIM